MFASTNSKLSQPAAAKAAAALFPFYDRIGIDPVQSPPLLAVSGGPDSMALAASFMGWWHDRGWGHFPCHAAVVDHGLRPESTREAETVAGRLEAIGLTVQRLTVAAPRPTAGVQAWARDQRYRLLAEAALRLSGDAVILTAHHRGDQAETVAMRLLHGSGVRGLAGISPSGVFGGVRLARPLLAVSPDDLRDLLGHAGIAAVDDPSNHDQRFERVRIRGLLAEKGPPDTASLLRLAAAAEAITARLHSAVADRIRGRAGVMHEGCGWCDRSLLDALPTRAAMLLLDGFVRAVGAQHQPPREAALKRLLISLRDGGEATLGGCEWRQDKPRQRLIIHREAETRLERLAVRAGQPGLFDGRWHVAAPVDGHFEAIGARRFAALRSGFPDLIEKNDLPARVFWSIPVFVPAMPITDIRLPALEDGSIITHLKSKFENGLGHPIMSFAGTAHWPWREAQQERQKP
ncbi:MAG: tRNA lysidine(34) synthetase TilS [Candidatus Puniceispirillales bacterium]